MQLEPATAHTPHQMCEVESEETQLREKGQIATKDLLQGARESGCCCQVDRWPAVTERRQQGYEERVSGNSLVVLALDVVCDVVWFFLSCLSVYYFLVFILNLSIHC